LIGAVLDDLNISDSVEISDLINLGPCFAGIGAAPDGCLETCHSEIGAAE
jgi:hypothetical protein